MDLIEFLFKIGYIFAIFIALGILTTMSAIVILRKWIYMKKEGLFAKTANNDVNVNVGIFHPYCNSGGGGERVLWCAVRALQEKYDNVRIAIYTGDIAIPPENILIKAKKIFNIRLDAGTISFIFLKKRHWIESRNYPYFTILGQSIGSIILGLEALCEYPPDVYIDTMGYAFTYPLFRFVGQCKVGCYVHYPIITADMLQKVQSREHTFNNQDYIIHNPFLTCFKLTYYRMFAKLYSLAGHCSQTIMVNSSWTENHILDLWGVPFKTQRVYPPCEVAHLKTIKIDQKISDKIYILSVGQFRPEKNHPLQLQIMYELRTMLNRDEDLWEKLRLVIVGSCRGDEDYERFQNIADLSKHLSLENSVNFRVNVSHQELLEWYQSSKIGLHTMQNEHFGIGIVEAMAAGLIMVANRSGGPLLDIVETSEGSQTGFLAIEAVEYARCIRTILYNSDEKNNCIRNAARSSVERFSEKEFEVNFLRAVSYLFNNQD